MNDSCSNNQREKLTFLNPSEDFKKRLIKAGGLVSVDFLFCLIKLQSQLFKF